MFSSGCQQEGLERRGFNEAEFLKGLEDIARKGEARTWKKSAVKRVCCPDIMGIIRFRLRPMIGFGLRVCSNGRECEGILCQRVDFEQVRDASVSGAKIEAKFKLVTYFQNQIVHAAPLTHLNLPKVSPSRFGTNPVILWLNSDLGLFSALEATL